MRGYAFGVVLMDLSMGCQVIGAGKASIAEGAFVGAVARVLAEVSGEFIASRKSPVAVVPVANIGPFTSMIAHVSF